MRFKCEWSNFTDLTFTKCNDGAKIEIEHLFNRDNFQVVTMYISRADALVLAQALNDYGNSPTPGDL